MGSKQTLTNSEIMSIANEFSDDSSYFDSSGSEEEESDEYVPQQSGCSNGIITDSNNSDHEYPNSQITHAITNTGAYVQKDVSDENPGSSETLPTHNLTQELLSPSDFDSETTPIQYFHLFFDNSFIQLIRDETALHGDIKKIKNTPPSKRSRHSNWSDPTTADIKAFLGVTLKMGLHPLPQITDYFSKSWRHVIPFLSDVFSKEEFLLLYFNLHFNHNNSSGQQSRIFPVQPIVDHVRQKCSLHYSPSRTAAVDESTTTFKDHVSFKCYSPIKPVKFGVKMFILADSTNGYIYNFKPYTGKTQSPHESSLLKTKIVKERSSGLIKNSSNPPSGCDVYSPQLADELLAMNFTTTGTVLPSKQNMQPQLKKNEVPKMKKSEVLSFRRDNILALTWKDKRTAHMLSSYHTDSKTDMSLTLTNLSNTSHILKPNAVLDYVKHMGGVDSSNHLISSYLFLRRLRKWSRKVFYWCLEVSVINSYILYCNMQKQHNKVAMSHKEFRQSLVESLVEERMLLKRASSSSSRNRGRSFCGPPEQRLDGKQHFMDRVEKHGGRCVVCCARKIRKETIYYCETCCDKPYLHPDKCFKLYHTKKKLT